MIFLRVLPKKFSLAPLLGGPGARGPRFIEPPEPPVPTPLLHCVQKLLTDLSIIFHYYMRNENNAQIDANTARWL